MMTIAFAGLEPIYMDDLMIKNLTDVFVICSKYNLMLHPEKCSFFIYDVTFLGHKWIGVLPDDKKFKVIKNYPVPHDADSVRRFVAFCNNSAIIRGT